MDLIKTLDDQSKEVASIFDQLESLKARYEKVKLEGTQGRASEIILNQIVGATSELQYRVTKLANFFNGHIAKNKGLDLNLDIELCNKLEEV
jgi:hypothetical protein